MFDLQSLNVISDLFFLFFSFLVFYFFLSSYKSLLFMMLHNVKVKQGFPMMVMMMTMMMMMVMKMVKSVTVVPRGSQGPGVTSLGPL